MNAVAFLGKKNIKTVDVKKPKVKEDGVLVKMKACGICGSDMHMYNSNLLVEDSTKPMDRYRIIGHEFTGEIVEVGRNIKNFSIGDRVASVHNKGGMAEYIEIHGDKLKNLYKIPETVSYETAATLEPFCNPMHSYHLRKPGDDETVAIFGAGIIGLGYLQIVKSYTKAKTIVVDISKLRLKMANNIGADIIINATDEDPVKKIKQITGEYYVRYQDKTAGGCDISIDCAGIPLTLQQSLEVLKPEQGTVIIAAIYEYELKLDPNMITFKYMSIIGSMGYYPSESSEAFDLISSGKVNRNILITQKFPLKKADDAFKIQGNPQESIKVIIVN